MLQEQKSVSELASAYEVHPMLLHKWKREAIEKLPRIFDDPRKKERDEKDAIIRDLYSRIGRLTMQLDWLEKKCGRSAPAN